MRVMPIRYARDVEASVAFYRALGLDLDVRSRPGGWAELGARAGLLAIHAAAGDGAGECELCFLTDEPLERVSERLQHAGYRPGSIVDENFGRSLTVADPDGVSVQVNEHDEELYT